jgi:hypothetical protein
LYPLPGNQGPGFSFIGTTSSAALISPPAGSAFPSVSAINNFGQVTGGAESASNGSQAFIGTTAGASLIPPPETGVQTKGFAINDSGQIAGVVYFGAFQEAFIGTINGSTVIPGIGPYPLVGVSGINSSGEVSGYVANSSTNSLQGFVGTSSGGELIPLPVGWTHSLAVGINNSGEVLGFGTGGVFIWDATNGLQLVDPLVPAGWTMANAFGINNAGQILGQAIDAAGTYDIVILSPQSAAPEPGTLALLAIALIFVALRRSRA